MLDLLGLYKWTLLGAIVAAPTLALIGAQILARGWATRAIIVSQASSTGVVLGLAILSFAGAVSGFYLFIGTLVISVLVSISVGALLVWSDQADLRRESSADPLRPAMLFSIYVGLMAIGSLVASLAPHLEVSQTASFIGDISTASDLEARTTLAVSMGLMGWLWSQWRALSFASFAHAVLFRQLTASQTWAFGLVSLTAMAVAMPSMGLIFVLGSLFAPIASVGKKNSNLERFRRDICIAAALGALIGFVVSLEFTKLPTAPSILIFQVLVGVTIRFLRR